MYDIYVFGVFSSIYDWTEAFWGCTNGSCSACYLSLAENFDEGDEFFTLLYDQQHVCANFQCHEQ